MSDESSVLLGGGTRRDCTREQAAHALLCQRHQRKRLKEVLAACGEGCTARRLLDAALDQGLAVDLAACQELLAEAGLPAPRRREGRTGLRGVILQAAQSFGRPFTKSELAVAAWKLAPGLCSLDGFPEYPDANLVLSYLYGRRGMIDRGEIVRAEEGKFAVPEMENDGQPEYNKRTRAGGCYPPDGFYTTGRRRADHVAQI